MKKTIAGILAFGSVWGLLETTLGDWLHQYDLSALMVAVGMTLMAVTRYRYGEPGMQAGMALVAATLRHLNPIGGACLVCASIAIVLQGVLFELFWTVPWHRYQRVPMRVSMGVITFFSVASVSYLATQTLTPALTATFHASDLAGVIPKIFAHGLVAGVAGSVALPFAAADLQVTVSDRLYYPVAAALTAVCWMAVVSVA